MNIHARTTMAVSAVTKRMIWVSRLREATSNSRPTMGKGFTLGVSSLKPTREPAALGQALLGFFELAFFQLVEVVVQVGLHAAGKEVEAKHIRERHAENHQISEVEDVGRGDD